MTRKFNITDWRTDAQSDSPPYPRPPWYSPFSSEQACRECAAKGDVVALKRVNAHEGGKNND